MAPPTTRAPISAPAPALGLVMVGGILATVLGLAAIAAGIVTLLKDMPGIMGYTLLIFGAALPPLSFLALHRSRAAWSFEISICVVFALLTGFGAPKVQALLGVPLAVTFVLPMLFAVVVILLASAGDVYRDQGIGTSNR